MLKKITFCFLAVLLICSFTIFAFAAQYQFMLADDTLIDYNDLTFGSDLWTGSGECTYSFSTPIYDYSNSVDIVAVKISVDNSLNVIAELYTASGVFYPNETPDLEAHGGIVTVDAPQQIDYDQAVAMFQTVFGSQAYAGTPPVHSGLFETFSTVFGWIVGVLVSIVSLFWANGSLTFFGICAIVALGIGLFLLIAHVISNFLQFRS